MNTITQLLPILHIVTPIAVVLFLLNNLKVALSFQITRGKKGKKSHGKKGSVKVKEFTFGYKDISIKVEFTA